MQPRSKRTTLSVCQTLRERFETYCFIKLRSALKRNRDLFPQPVIDRILAHPSIDGRLNELLDYAGEHGIPLYVLIDEYDNFANTILAHRGAKAYESFTHGGGFYRNFFATLKAGAGTAAAWSAYSLPACRPSPWTT